MESDQDSDDDLGGAFERGARAWFVELAFWRPLKLTDDEMALFFRRRDGKWSEQTKAALTGHKARGLDLNQNWALVEQNWVCPACRRGKVEIFRLSARGILLAKLEEHHDHLRDFVTRRAQELLGQEWLRSHSPGAIILIDRIRDLVSAFSAELLCSECNAADGAAKARLQGRIHSHFSFSPREICGFIRSRRNSPHDIDFAKAESAWERLRPGFEARLKLIDNLLESIKSGALVYERGTPWFDVAQRQFDPQAQLHQAFLLEADRDERQRELSSMLDEFFARSVQKDSPIVAPKTKPVSISVRVPSQAEYEAYCDPVSPRRWRETPDSWRCPVCERQKRDVMRISKSGKWSGGVRVHFQPIAERDPTSLWARRRLLPGFRNEFVMCESESLLICSSCQDVSIQLKQRRQDIPDQFLYTHDLRECLVAIAPHVSHEVDWDEAANRVLSNASVSSAWHAYWKHCEMAAKYWNEYQYLTNDLGHDFDRAVHQLSENVMFDAKIDDLVEAKQLTQWLLEDAKRRSTDEGHRVEDVE